MKKVLILTTMLFALGFANAQTFNKSLAGMYESTSGSDWISLRDNGTGRLDITNIYLNLGSLSFTWTSDEDQIFIKFKDELGYDATKWCYWAKKNGISSLDFPTLGPYLNFIRTN